MKVIWEHNHANIHIKEWETHEIKHATKEEIVAMYTYSTIFILLSIDRDTKLACGHL